MKLTRPPRAAHTETITALIDVVFFLLVFFMLIGRMDATAPFEVEPPIAETGTDMPAGGVTISISAAGNLALDGTAIKRRELDTEIMRMLGENPDLRLRLNAHRDAQLRHVLPLIGAAEAMGVRDVVIVVTPAMAP